VVVGGGLQTCLCGFNSHPRLHSENVLAMFPAPFETRPLPFCFAFEANLTSYGCFYGLRCIRITCILLSV
jgi:hypothetical protein